MLLLFAPVSEPAHGHGIPADPLLPDELFDAPQRFDVNVRRAWVAVGVLRLFRAPSSCGSKLLG